MADTKITALTALTAADPINDVIPIVDVSDTTMAASGTTKKISVNNILSSSPTASGALTVTGLVTAGSATITGALTANGNIAMANATAITSGGAVVLYVDTNLVAIRARATNGIRFQESTGVNNLLTVSDAGVFGFLDGAGGTRMTLNSTGLGIGGSPRTKFDVLLSGTANTGGSLAPSLGLFTGPGLVPLIDGSRAGANVNIESNTAQGINVGASLMLGGRYADSSTASSGFAALFGAKSTATSNTISGYLAFYTSSAAVMTERMRLDDSGNLYVGKTSSSSASTGCELQTGTGGNAASVFTADGATVSIMNRLTSDGTIIDFRRQTSSVGSIAVTTTATAYNTSSDYRLKEDAQPLVGGLARVNALKPSIYKWKVNGSTGEGFIAHELAETVPFAVTGDKDAVDADGKPAYQGVDLSKIVPILVAAIQELTARVQTLETR